MTTTWTPWEQLYDRLFRLAYLAEVLPDFMKSAPSSAWLYKEIEKEAGAIAAIARAYIEQAERAAEYARQAPTRDDVHTDHHPATDKKRADSYRPVPKPRDPRGRTRGDHE